MTAAKCSGTRCNGAETHWCPNAMRTTLNCLNIGRSWVSLLGSVFVLGRLAVSPLMVTAGTECDAKNKAKKARMETERNQKRKRNRCKNPQATHGAIKLRAFMRGTTLV